MQLVSGMEMRSKYIINENSNFLPANYNPEKIIAFSDNDNRTIRSAQAHLLGLYPFGTGPSIPNNLYPQDLTFPPFN